MKNFQQINIELLKSDNIRIDYFESDLNASLLLIKLEGIILDGSKGSLNCEYISQKIALALVSTTFTAVILDLTNLEYSFGNSIVNAFMPLENIRIGEDKYLTAYVLSDKNKIGLSNLWCFDLKKPKEPIFYDLEDAEKYIENKFITL